MKPYLSVKQFCRIDSLIVLLIMVFGNNLCLSQPKTDSLLAKILYCANHEILKNVLDHKDSFRVQIIYTQIDRNRNNKPSFKNYYFNTDSNLYFNPASTVKLPIALLALEKLNGIRAKNVDKYSTIEFEKNKPWQTAEISDSSSQTGLASVAHYIKRMLLVSENDPYNRLYQFVGQKTIHRQLSKKGYHARFPRQFLGLTTDQNRHTNGVIFRNSNGHPIYYQYPFYNTDSIYFGKVIKLGKAHYNNKDSLIYAPIDFSKANYLPLEELHLMLRSVLFPKSVPSFKRFKLKKDDHRFLLQYLSQYPHETNYPKYDSTQYYESYVKYYFNQRSRQMPSDIRVFNKVGWAYGFLIDASYIIDFKNKIEYMLTSTVYVNSDDILNDDKYDYETVGLPFLNQLGESIHQYEISRPRKYAPDLKKFRITYETREKDTRPSIKNVDN